jgi:hypothetical protein
MSTPLAEQETAMAPAQRPDARTLPSGRSVTLRVGPDNEEIEIRSREGMVEVQITLTEQGPVVRLRAARLELAAAQEMRLECDRLTVHAREAAAVDSGGELRLRSEQDTHINGRMIYLNS